jgi:AraC-like DNA-binding protein
MPPPAAAQRRMPARYVALLRDAVRDSGIDPQAWLVASGIDAGRIDAAEGAFTPEEFARLFAAARQLTGRSDLGFEVGQRVKLTSHDQLSLGLLGSRNFDQVFRIASRHFHVMLETFTLRYRRTPAQGELLYTPTVPMSPEVLRFCYEAIAGSVQKAAFSLLGPMLMDLELAMPPPPHLRRYDALLPARFHFNATMLPGIRVTVDAAQLDQPLPLADERAVRLVDERYAAAAPQPGTQDIDWAEVVRLALREAQGATVTLQSLAERYRISERTIDRQLKKRQLQFRDLAQQVRFERACELLALQGATVAQVALQLGFSDAANFTRAFKRQLGIAPSEYQARTRRLPPA